MTTSPSTLTGDRISTTFSDTTRRMAGISHGVYEADGVLVFAAARAKLESKAPDDLDPWPGTGDRNSRLRRPGSQGGMDLRHGRGAVSNGGGHALGRACPDIADGEHTAPAGFEIAEGAIRPTPANFLPTGDHEAFRIEVDAAVQPRRIGLRADEQEQMAERTGPPRADVS